VSGDGARALSNGEMALYREDLQNTYLSAGDTIEYYSQQYPAGDPRGLKTAIVSAVRVQDDYPLRLNSREVVHKFSMVRRVASPDPTRIRTGWRKVRTFDLVESTRDVPTAASELNDRLRAVVADVMRGVTGPSMCDDASSCHSSPKPTSLDKSASDSEESLSASHPALPLSVDIEVAVDEAQHRELVRRLRDVPTAADIRKRHHQSNPKNTGGWTGKRSRKKKYRAMSGIRRDTVAVYNCNTPGDVWLRQYFALTHIREALNATQKHATEPTDQADAPEVVVDPNDADSATIAPADTLPAETRRSEKTKTHESDDECSVLFNESESVVAIHDQTGTGEGDRDAAEHYSRSAVVADINSKFPDRQSVKWPASVARLYATIMPKGVRFKSVGSVGRCECASRYGRCYAFLCLNSLSQLYCTRKNCSLGGRCGNALDEDPSLALFNAGERGIGVYSTTGVEAGIILAEYAGHAVAYDAVTEGHEAGATWNHNSGYSLLLDHKAIGGKYIYIEPEKAGSIARFINHACEANCQLREVRYFSQIRIAVVTARNIAANEEITVRYNTRVWFKCVRLRL